MIANITLYEAALKPSPELPASLPKWIQAKRYAAISGYSYDAVRMKCHKGVWPEGIIWKKAQDGHLIINWRAADIWLEQT